LAGGEGLEERPIETASGAVIDVLDGGRLAELGVAQAACEAAVISGGDLTIDEETEPIGVRHLGCLGIVKRMHRHLVRERRPATITAAIAGV
jgi:hypothetical protein